LFLGFWLFAGLAWETGVDWKLYSEAYKYSLPIYEVIEQSRFYSVESSNLFSIEFIFNIISSLAKVFGDDFVLFNCIISLLSAIFFFKAINRYTLNLFFPVMLYFGCIYITLNISGIRQGLALVIAFYAYGYIADKKFWKYTLWILVATGIHSSAIALFPLYFLVRHRFSNNAVYIITGIGLIVYLLRIPIMINLLYFIANISNNEILKKLSLYLTLIEDNVFAMMGISPKILFYIVLLIVVFYLRKQLCEHNRFNNMFMNIFFIYVILNLYFWSAGEIIMRFGFYFLVSIIVILPELMSNLKYRSNQIIIILLMLGVAFISRTPVFLESLGALPYTPYQNYIIYQLTNKPSTGQERLEKWDGSDQ
jgi:hypothetical protein